MASGGDLRALLQLMTWLSPAFPVGAFAYSGGLERAVRDGMVGDATTLKDWAKALVAHGSGWNDAVLLAESHRRNADGEWLADIAELAEALAGSRERHMETMLLGEAFIAAAGAWPDPVLSRLLSPVAYPVAVGAVAGAHGVAPAAAVGAFLHAGVSQLVSVGIRLSVCGQRDGVAVIAALEKTIAEVALKAASSTLDDLGSSTLSADIASLRHETQGVRLFRS